MQKGRWFSFAAHERLDAGIGFHWAARLRYRPLVLTGADQLRSGQASLDFRPFGVVPFLRAAGPDVVRAARGRLAIEALGDDALRRPLPTVILSQMVEYSAQGLDATYRALAHPIRRRMLERLAADGSRVTRLAAGFGISLAAASKHIRVLEDAGLVHRTVIGRDHHLSLRAEPLTEAAAWIERSQQFWKQRVDGLDVVLREGPR